MTNDLIVHQSEFNLWQEALFRHTRPAWELIVVDNGSTDGTAAYLAGVRDAAGVPVTVDHQCPEPRVPRGDQPGPAGRAAGNTWCCSTTTRSSPTAGSISSSP